MIGAMALLGIVSALCLHETVRIVLFRRYGVVVRELEVSLTGGSPRLIDRTDSPGREVIAGSGGLVVIAMLAGGAIALARLALPPASHDLAELLAISLAALAITQTLPALSLDGGRLIRGLVWFLTDDPVRGARGAALYGHVVSAAMIVAGLLLMGRSGALPYWGFGAVVAGLQLIAASTASLRDSMWQQLGGTLSLADADLPLPARVSASASLENVVDTLIEEGHQSAVLVIDENGDPAGVIQLANLRRVRRMDWADRRADEVMTPIGDLLELSPDVAVLDAVAALDQAQARLALVTVAGGPVLLITREQMLNRLLSRSSEQSNELPLSHP
jgi:CBS domain-containing protein